ncbi:ABC transporter ATP-binding protein [Streptomyces sporangiiformans]|uniref:ABC transporter ATP-binding protein n=1 Tax=Streptomyces sporangiiformans TaxID=2315329 RepID=A0A505DLD3_9ACTN|nr:ABC transporter ATP-binding protein [Streptomyces sporangiiformans]TPQ22728.1 ABC transporter ATP-binding protein [Streptomyces sporangiiformans]
MSADEHAPVLAADDIVAGYLAGIDVLRGCSVQVEPGELVGVIGPNGAGKSTLIKAVFGLLRVRSGTVRLLGEDVTGRSAHEQVRRGVGYVPQLENVFPALTVEENLRMGIYLRPKDYARRAAAMAELFPVLAARRRQKAGSMSGGERQMLAMARALMMEPRLLLLDEPSAGLSPVHQDLVFERVREINGAGVAVLMVEQNARRCLQICDRGYVLDQGRNAYSGTGAHLLRDEKVIELYLGTLARVR